MLLSCRLTLTHHTPPWLHTTRAKLCQYEAKDFDVIANVPQKEHILKKMYFWEEASAVEMHTMQS